jgi:steroid delta-isomerase-like uncharacterized protein
MTAAENKRRVTEFYEGLWGRGDYSAATGLFAPGYIRHDLRAGTPLPGAAGQVQIARDFRAAFPDLKITVDLLVAEDEFVTARWTMRGTNTGAWGKTPPSGRSIVFSGVNIFRFAEEKVVELWNYRDDLGLYEQLGRSIFAGAKPE